MKLSVRYVWKLLYAYMLGYEIDFGHFQALWHRLEFETTHTLFGHFSCEAVELCSASKFSEKTAGCSTKMELLGELWGIQSCFSPLWGFTSHCLKAFSFLATSRYLATSLLLADNNDMVRMIVNSVKTDMASGNEARDIFILLLGQVLGCCRFHIHWGGIKQLLKNS